MNLIDERITAYLEKYSSAENSILKQLNRETQQKILQPRMLSGHLQGRALSMFSKMIKPKHILEIGTYTGYSALCLCEGLIDGGHLDTVDKNEELSDISLRHFKNAGYAKNITLHVGDAVHIIPTLQRMYDLVFIDADKLNYISYYNLIMSKMNVGAFIIADNVLWDGKVLNEKETDYDLNTEAVANFNAYVHCDARVENVMLPIRDGLTILQKVSNA